MKSEYDYGFYASTIPEEVMQNEQKTAYTNDDSTKKPQRLTHKTNSKRE